MSSERDTVPPPPPPARSALARAMFTALALLSLGVGILGLFLPGLPSTEFFLLAGWLATRGSPRLRAWLYRHPVIGPVLLRWQAGRRVSRRSKWSAAIAMTVSAAVLAWAVRPVWLAAGSITCMALVLGWLWRRPE